MANNKSGFEIRTDILAMAKDYMDAQYQLNVEFATRAFDEALKSGKVAADQWKTFAPEMYTIEDVMKKAQELYGFVAKKD